MVSNVTSYSRSGLRDWLLQRASAYVLAAYLVFLLAIYLANPVVDYKHWHHLFQHVTVKVFTLLAFISMGIHAWIGVWTIFTDYIKHTGLRLMLEALVLLALVVYVLWGVVILWSV
jgi:succinate dehydrogenase / fumarate reductase membrane anchor subunit